MSDKKESTTAEQNTQLMRKLIDRIRLTAIEHTEKPDPNKVGYIRATFFVALEKIAAEFPEESRTVRQNTLQLRMLESALTSTEHFIEQLKPADVKTGIDKHSILLLLGAELKRVREELSQHDNKGGGK